MVRKENSLRRNSSPFRGRAESPRRRRTPPENHRSINRRNSPPPYRTPPRHREHSPLIRHRVSEGKRSPLRQRSPIIHQRSPQRGSHPRQGSPPRNRMASGMVPPRSPPSRRRLPVRRNSPIRTRSPLGKEHIVRRQRSPLQQTYRRKMSHSPQRRVRSPLMESPPRHSDQAMRHSPRNTSPIHRTSRRSPSPCMRPALNRSKHSIREELIISSRRSVTPPRVRHNTSPLTNHRITVCNDTGANDSRTIGSTRRGGKVRAREDRMTERRDERSSENSKQSRYEDQGNNRIRRIQGTFDHSPPRKRPIRRSPMRLNHPGAAPERSRFSPDMSKGRLATRPRGRSPKPSRDLARGRSPQARVLLETPEISVQQDRVPSPRPHKMSERRREDHGCRSRRRQSDSRRNNEDDYVSHVLIFHQVA